MLYAKIKSLGIDSWRSSLLSYLILSLVLLAWSSCNVQNEESKQTDEVSLKDKMFSYDLGNPSEIFDLPIDLEEISGISFYKKNKIACIEDERAIIYIFDTKKGEVTSKYEFLGKDDDYEDIEVVGDKTYVLRSDGTIFKLNKLEKKGKIRATKIKTILGKKNNTEGLAFEKSTNSLLIACKNSPSINKAEPYEGFKAVYRFDLKNDKLIEKPAYLLDLSDSDSLYDTGTVGKFFIERAKKLGLTDGANYFHPSAIAIHPFDESKIYLISSSKKLLIIMNKNGLIIDIHVLDKRIFNQPEGICFSKNGDLYISNEGDYGTGNILKFKFLTNTTTAN